MVIPSQILKGQVFFKYLWQHDFYKTEGGVSPVLSRDLKNLCLDNGLISENKVITNTDIFNWINGSVIPRWARLSAFQLALRLMWRPVDIVDCMSVLMIENEELTLENITRLVNKYEGMYNITFPRPILNKIVNDL